MKKTEDVLKALFNCATNPHPCCMCEYMEIGINASCQNALMLDAAKIIEKLKGEHKNG